MGGSGEAARAAGRWRLPAAAGGGGTGGGRRRRLGLGFRARGGLAALVGFGGSGVAAYKGPGAESRSGTARSRFDFFLNNSDV